MLKRRLPGLHQLTELGCVALREVWEPTEEGLDRYVIEEVEDLIVLDNGSLI